MEREQIDWLARAARRKVSLTGLASREDGSQQRIVVTDLSYNGCHVFCEDPFYQGETFKLIVPTMGTIDVQVRWTEGESAGVHFLVQGSVAEARRARLGF